MPEGTGFLTNYNSNNNTSDAFCRTRRKMKIQNIYTQ